MVTQHPILCFHDFNCKYLTRIKTKIQCLLIHDNIWAIVQHSKHGRIRTLISQQKSVHSHVTFFYIFIEVLPDHLLYWYWLFRNPNSKAYVVYKNGTLHLCLKWKQIDISLYFVYDFVVAFLYSSKSFSIEQDVVVELKLQELK